MRAEREKPWSRYPEDEGMGASTEPDPEFTRRYWRERVESKDHPSQVRVDGRLYWIGEERVTGMPRGCYGEKFRIRFHDGREITTTNLWVNGEIPAEFRAELPDNAVFLDRLGREVDFWGHRKDGVDEREQENQARLERWLAGVERRREELKRQPWVPKWQWKKQRGIP